MRAVHWFRGDLRLRDNTALRDAAHADELALVFVLDQGLLDEPDAPRVRFLLDCVSRLADQIARAGSTLTLRRGDPVAEIERILRETRADLLTWNRDTTPYARRRDAAVTRAAGRLGTRILDRPDRVVLESGQVTKKTGGPYGVYSPYSRAWMARLADESRRPERAPRLPRPIAGLRSVKLPTPATPTHGPELPAGGADVARRRLRTFLERGVADYASRRDLPAVDGTSRLSPYLRFGAISPRDCVYAARDAAEAEPALRQGARKWIDELVWRDFYAGILERNPENLKRSHRREFDAVCWIDDEKELAAWEHGRTGFPIVDAGMRQLRETGWMHNRVRMVVASFLVKDLLIDWRRGERFFYRHLVDGDPASNNGGWQWAASTGTDPQPYFRIFNPTTQGQRFDPDGDYVRRYVPELRGLPGGAVHEPSRQPLLAPDYAPPIVDHKERRLLALERFGEARKAGTPVAEEA